MKLISKILLLSSGVAMLSLGACKKDYLDRLPTDQVPIEDVFKTTTGCKQALEGIHSLMFRNSDPESFGQRSIDLINDVMGEDMPFEGFGAGWFVNYANYNYAHSGVGTIWNFYYQIINNANAILDNIDGATGPESEKDNIKGQVYFYLAYAYYNLSIYYQHTYASNPNALGVPIYHHVTREGNARAPLNELYAEIQGNLRKAEKYLSPATGTPTIGNKSEIHVETAYGLHARVALVMQNWALADSMAGAARVGHPYMPAQSLLEGFNSMQNSAWIWASHLVEEQTNFVESFISQLDINANGYAALGQQKEILKYLYDMLPDGSDTAKGFDVRRNWWFNKDTGNYVRYSQNKFRVITPGSFSLDVCYMRAEEMGLIQAEAKAQNNDIPGAQGILQELMEIRNPKYDATKFNTKSKVLLETWYQRRVELWGEGFRYSDIQRCAAIPEAVGSNFPGYLTYQGLSRNRNANGDFTIYGNATSYQPNDFNFLFIIPQSEMNYNQKMVQNTP